MLGLQRGTVRLAEHHSEWHRLFQREKERLLGGLGEKAVVVEHVGSTAIPFVPARPIIDIVLGIDPAVEFNDLKRPLTNLGYEERGPQGVEDRILWVFGSENNRKYYLHLTHRGNKTWNDCIVFRAALRSTASLRKEYAKLKEGLAANYAEDRASYTKGKHEFIEHVVHQYQLSRRQSSRESMADEILSSLKRNQNILLVGRRDAGKTYFVTQTLVPFLQREGMHIRYYKDMEEESHAMPENVVVIFDEFEMLDDRESLERMHPEEQPYYSDSYLQKVHSWIEKAGRVPNRRVFVLSRNEEDIGNVMNIASFIFATNVVAVEIVPWEST